MAQRRAPGRKRSASNMWNRGRRRRTSTSRKKDSPTLPPPFQHPSSTLPGGWSRQPVRTRVFIERNEFWRRLQAVREVAGRRQVNAECRIFYTKVAKAAKRRNGQDRRKSPDWCHTPGIRGWGGKYFFTADHRGILRNTAEQVGLTAGGGRTEVRGRSLRRHAYFSGG